MGWNFIVLLVIILIVIILVYNRKKYGNLKNNINKLSFQDGETKELHGKDNDENLILDWYIH